MTTTVTRTRILAVAIVFLFTATLVLSQGQTAKVQIIPAPKEIHASEATFVFGRDARVILVDPGSADDRFAAEDFVDDLRQTTGLSLKVGGHARHEILIGQMDLPRIQQALKRASVDLGQKLTGEGYVVAVSANEVVVAGKTAAGTFYGIQTLK